MQREIPLGLAIVIIAVAALIIVGVGWFLMNRRPTGEGVAPKEFMPQKPPYAPGGGLQQPRGRPF
ncbi:MAG: hypothetical protein C4295_12345 [Candidatus Fervidibacterota bacterium]